MGCGGDGGLSLIASCDAFCGSGLRGGRTEALRRVAGKAPDLCAAICPSDLVTGLEIPLRPGLPIWAPFEKLLGRTGNIRPPVTGVADECHGGNEHELEPHPPIHQP